MAISGSETRQRSLLLQVRLTAEEHAAIHAAAARAGLSAGAYVRHVALGDAGPRAARRPLLARTETARLLGRLGEIGAQVNAVAAAIADEPDIAPNAQLADHWRQAAADIGIMRRELLEALGRGD